ncbi:MAG: RNA polymerase sigma factor [Planctomycetes bacterium]|nr:RNA polymerase sigma factor [Planctomycetota bacterium]
MFPSTFIADVYRTESRRVLATLVRLLRDLDLAEEALAEAFAAATEAWPREGVPANPRAWLISTGRFRAIDTLRRRSKFHELQPELVRRQEDLARSNEGPAEGEIEDDRLRLIFACCHPAIDPQIQVALTLREVCGLTTDEIAAAFLVAPATMAQRIVRGRAKIRDAGIPIQVPDREDLPARLESILAVCYLVFNEGYSATSGPSLTRADLSGEAIRLGRLLCELLPDAEVFGLLALMLFHESRRPARTDDAGDLVLLEDQDRTRWDRELIREAQGWLARALETGEVGTYGLQAAISAVHAEAPTADLTNWQRIVEWYDLLLQAAPSPVVELNRAVAVGMRDHPDSGLALIEPLRNRKELAEYHLLHAARADFLRRAGRRQEAVAAYRQALALAKQEPERRFLERQVAKLT